MAKAQLENGYTRIANELLEAICGAPLSRNELKVLFALMRLSFGWSEKNTGDRAGLGELVRLTGLRSNQIYSTISSLKASLIVAVEKPNRTNRYSVVTDPEKWCLAEKLKKNRLTGHKSSLVAIRDQSRNMTSQESLPDLVTNRDQTIVTIRDYSIVTNRDQIAAGRKLPESDTDTPKEIKEIKERKEKKEEGENPSFLDQNLITYKPQPTNGKTTDEKTNSEWQKAMGAFQLTEVEKMNIKVLCDSGCQANDLEKARINNPKFYGIESEYGRRQITKQRDIRIKETEKEHDHNPFL